jgi:hypothetical protein
MPCFRLTSAAIVLGRLDLTNIFAGLKCTSRDIARLRNAGRVGLGDLPGIDEYRVLTGLKV